MSEHEKRYRRNFGTEVTNFIIGKIKEEKAKGKTVKQIKAYLRKDFAGLRAREINMLIKKAGK